MPHVSIILVLFDDKLEPIFVLKKMKIDKPLNK